MRAWILEEGDTLVLCLCLLYRGAPAVGTAMYPSGGLGCILTEWRPTAYQQAGA